MKLWLKGISGSWCETVGAAGQALPPHPDPLCPPGLGPLTSHPGQLVTAEGATRQQGSQAGQGPPGLQLHPGQQRSVTHWPEGAGWKTCVTLAECNRAASPVTIE